MTSQKIFFSVIIPYYNREEFILAGINSVLVQEFENYELILVNDASTDNGPLLVNDMIKKLDQVKQNKITHFHLSQNKGVSYARNLAARNAQGKFLAFLDSDDRFLPRKLLWQHNYIQKNPQTKILHGNEEWIRNGQPLNQLGKHKKGGGDQFFNSLKLCCISPSCVVLDKSFFWQHGGFREDFPVCEDYDLWLKMTLDHKVGFLEQNLITKFGGHEDQLSQKYFAMDYYRILSLIAILNQIDRKKDALKFEEVTSQIIKRVSRLFKGATKHKNETLLEQLTQDPIKFYTDQIVNSSF